MKIVGVILVSVLPILIGLEVKGSLKKRLDIMESYYRLIIFIKEQIRYFSREIDEITALMKNTKEFSAPRFSVVWDFGREKALPRDAEKRFKDMGLKEDFIKPLLGFLEGLGLNDTEGQLNHCSYYEQEVLKQINIFYKDFRQRNKLYLSLSVAASLVLFILMI